MTDFRALCEELLADYEQNRFQVELAAEARAALAQTEPPTLKEQAMQLLEIYNTLGISLPADQATTIRRALEALPND